MEWQFENFYGEDVPKFTLREPSLSPSALKDARKWITAIDSGETFTNLERKRGYWNRRHNRGVCTPNDALLEAISRNHMSYATFLMKRFQRAALHVDSSKWKEGLWSLLAQAIFANKPEFVEMLARATSKWTSAMKYPYVYQTSFLSQLSSQGSVLHVAALCGTTECLAILLYYGNPSKRLDENGQTPLQACLRKSAFTFVKNLSGTVHLLAMTQQQLTLTDAVLIKEMYENPLHQGFNGSEFSYCSIPAYQEQVCVQVSSLKHLARHTLRRQPILARNLPNAVYRLPIPPMLQHYLAFDELRQLGSGYCQHF